MQMESAYDIAQTREREKRSRRGGFARLATHLPELKGPRDLVATTEVHLRS